MVDSWLHMPEVGGSYPSPATHKALGKSCQTSLASLKDVGVRQPFA